MLKKKSGDRLVALSVIACSVALLIALALGLSGQTFIRGGQSMRVRFPDVTGIMVSSRVKFAGAPVGTVSQIRILSPAERKADSPNLVEVTLLIHKDVPPLPNDARISIAADTLLSDKFVLINGGSPTAPPAGPDQVLQGVAPTTFDQLVRNADGAIEGLRRLAGGDNNSSTQDIFQRLRSILDDTGKLLGDAKPVVANAGSVMTETRTVLLDARAVVGEARSAVGDARAAASEARGILAENKPRIARAMEKIDTTATSFDSLARRGESFLRSNEGRLNRTLADFRIGAENLRVTSVYAKFLLRDLAQRPSRLIWGGAAKPPPPTEGQILNSRD